MVAMVLLLLWLLWCSGLLPQAQNLSLAMEGVSVADIAALYEQLIPKEVSENFDADEESYCKVSARHMSVVWPGLDICLW